MQEMVSASQCTVLHPTPNKGEGGTDSLTGRKRRRKKRYQNVCYKLVWIYGLWTKKSNNHSCTHNTPQTAST